MDKNRAIDFTHYRLIEPRKSSETENQEPSFLVEVKASSIQDRPTVTIENTSTKESYTIPADFMHYLQAYGENVYSEYRKHKEDEQYQTNHPSQFADIVQYQPTTKDRYKQEKNGGAYSLAGHDLSDEMTPVIRWTSGRSDSRGIETIPPAWNLYLVGAKDTRLQRVVWDDKAGIEGMLESMKDPEALLSALALLNTEAARRITSRRVAVGLKSERNLPEITLAPLKKFLKDQGLDGDATSSKNRIGILTIKSEGIRIPVGLIVTPSNSPTFGLSLNRPKEEGYDGPSWRAKIDAERTAHQAEWLRRFESNIEGIGWRIVDTKNIATTHRDRILITCLPTAVWRPIELAAGLAFDNANPIVSF